MLAAIKHGLRNLTRFQGRDARQTFWFYALFVYLMQMAISYAITLPMTIGAGMRAFANASAGGSPEAVQASAITSMIPMMRSLMWVSVVSGVLLLAFLATSLVRRLHDSDLSGRWAALPGVLQVIALAAAPIQIEGIIDRIERAAGDPIAMQVMIPGQVAWSLVGWGAIAAVVVFGVRKSTPEPNRFGETSVSF